MLGFKHECMQPQIRVDVQSVREHGTGNALLLIMKKGKEEVKELALGNRRCYRQRHTVKKCECDMPVGYHDLTLITVNVY